MGIEEKVASVELMAIGTPGYYYTDPNAIVVPTQLTGQSTNVHTKPHMLWADGNEILVAVKSTHDLSGMTLNGKGFKSFKEYGKLISIYIDNVEYVPSGGLQGNEKDSRWTVFTFNMADLNLNDSGTYPFYVKGIGGGHDVSGSLLFLIPKTTIEAKKVWVGGTERPAITLQLMAQVGNEGKKVLRTGEVDGSGHTAWVYKWTDVPEYDPYGRKYTFTADEETVPVNYEKSIDGLTVTNTYNPETIAIAVNKQWIGPNVDAVTIKLFANGADTGKTLELTEGNNWSGSFTSLNVYHDQTGEKITYTVEEVTVPGYTTEKSGSITDGFTFTNTNDTKLNIEVEKDGLVRKQSQLQLCFSLMVWILRLL
ncbi:Cna B-type domain-containing protein [Bacillus sp. N9]